MVIRFPNMNLVDWEGGQGTKIPTTVSTKTINYFISTYLPGEKLKYISMKRFIHIFIITLFIMRKIENNPHVQWVNG